MITVNGLRLLGFAFKSSSFSPTPVEWAYLPVKPGLTVLYGLNGAGKSTLLHGIEQALTGLIDARATLLNPEAIVQIEPDSVRANGGDDGAIGWGPLPLYRGLAGPDPDWSSDRLDEQGLMPVGDLFTKLAEMIQGQVDHRSLAPPGFDSWDFAWEVVDQHLFAARGAGTAAPSWRIDPLLIPSDQTPQAQSLLTAEGRAAVSEPMFLPLSPYWSKAPGPDSGPSLFDLNGLVSWHAVSLPVPLLGRRDFEPDVSTRRLFLEIESRLRDDSAVQLPTAVDEFIEVATALPTEDLIAIVAANSRFSDDADNPVQARWRAVSESFSRQDWILLDGRGQLRSESGVQALAANLATSANGYYARVLADAPVLSLRLGSPREWLAGSGMAWGAQRSAHAPWIRLAHLSHAERKWALIAIELALAIQPEGILLIDEPEQALHRSAEKQMAEQLRCLSEELNLAVVVASHSPELLDQSGAHVHLVRRRDDQGLIEGHQVIPLGPDAIVELGELGLRPADLLNRTKGFVLVEGEHDKAVLDGLFGGELTGLKVAILPFRGTGRLKSTLDAQVLYDYTDAHLFVMVDALEPAAITDIWDHAVRLAKTKGVDAAIDHVKRAMSDFSLEGEAGAVSGFMCTALQRGLDARLTPITLSRRDVLEYLPVQEFVAGASSWDTLWEEFVNSGPLRVNGTTYKEWLRATRQADLSPAAVRAVAAMLTESPPELQSHLQRIRNTLQPVL